MSFNLNSPTRAKRVAETLQPELKAHGVNLGWSQTLSVVARMYGHEHWSALEKTIGKAKASPDDTQVSTEELNDRLKQQADVLVTLGLKPDLAREIVARVRPTARRRVDKQSDAQLAQELDVSYALAEDVRGNWRSVGSICAKALTVAEGEQKTRFLRLLNIASARSPMAQFERGLTYLYGYAGGADVGVAQSEISGARRRFIDIDVELDPEADDAPSMVGIADLILGDLALKAEVPDPVKALEFWGEGLGSYGNLMCAVRLAKVYLRQGRADDAKAFEAVILAGDDPQALQALAVVYTQIDGPQSERAAAAAERMKSLPVGDHKEHAKLVAKVQLGKVGLLEAHEASRSVAPGR